VKARKVAGLEPDGPLIDNARRIAEVRQAELESFIPKVLDPAEKKALHDMRIAAKRLRYVLELFAPALDEDTRATGKRARALQEALGEIHDCDELVARLRDSGRPLHLAIAHVSTRRAELFERFVRDLERRGFSAAGRAPEAREDEGAA
jgi:CHAD domain-containing protein